MFGRISSFSFFLHSSRSFTCVAPPVKRQRNFWKSKSQQREFLDHVEKELNITEKKEWYKVTKQQILAHNGRGLFNEYRNLYEALQTIYPEYSWDATQFFPYPAHLLDQNEFRCLLFQKIEEKMNISKPEDWYKYNAEDIRKLGRADALLRRLGPSLLELLQHFYPNYSWNKYLFQKKPPGYWLDVTNHHNFLSALLSHMNISPSDMKACSNITTKDIKLFGGAAILTQYNSLLTMFKTLLPQHDWQFDSLPKVPKNYWENQERVMEFIKRCEEKYKIKGREDWYRVSGRQIIRLPGGPTLIKEFGTLYELLCFAYPFEKWDKKRITKRDKKSSQRWLFILTKSLFPDYEVIEEFHYIVKGKGEYSNKATSYEFDIFIPELKFAIEYQGVHHYQEIPSFGPLELYQERDQRKKDFCKENNINLLCIPYSWDAQEKTLRHYFTAPDLKYLAISQESNKE